MQVNSLINLTSVTLLLLLLYKLAIIENKPQIYFLKLILDKLGASKTVANGQFTRSLQEKTWSARDKVASSINFFEQMLLFCFCAFCNGAVVGVVFGFVAVRIRFLGRGMFSVRMLSSTGRGI
jgi:hypothetical protein